jgi:hypothetical protein
MNRAPEASTHGWRNRPLVREPDPHRARVLWRTLAAVALALAPAGVFLVQQNEYVSLSYDVETLRSEQEALQEIERDLRVERAELESLPSIERWAVEDRGLVRPAPESVVVVTPKRVESERLVADAGEPEHPGDGS